ncbi:MAG: GxxExxY protein [Candidatus Hydrogenedentes bacterium]|nr:GxxExxY protein [Candidatus Hydrogenedentota bacterium]
MTENQIGTAVVELAIEIHRELGPGLYENVYETVLAYELESHGLAVVRQVPVPIRYKHLEFQEGFKADMIVNDKVILELKSVETITKSHKKQLLTYLRLKGFKLGYLLNFGEALMKDGIYRIVNNLEEDVQQTSLTQSR